MILHKAGGVVVDAIFSSCIGHKYLIHAHKARNNDAMFPRLPMLINGLVDFRIWEARGFSRLGRCALNARWRLVALVVGAEVFEDTGGGLHGAAMVGAFRKFGADRANNARPKKIADQSDSPWQDA